MVDAVSFSAIGYRGASGEPQARPAAAAVESRPVLAALAVPVTQVSTPSDTADADDVGFLYAANGRPESAALPSYAVPPSQETTDERVAAGRDQTARLAMESTELDALLSSLMAPAASQATAVTETVSALPTAETNSEQLSRIARQSVIAQYYSQF